MWSTSTGRSRIPASTWSTGSTGSDLLSEHFAQFNFLANAGRILVCSLKYLPQVRQAGTDYHLFISGGGGGGCVNNDGVASLLIIP